MPASLLARFDRVSASDAACNFALTSNVDIDVIFLYHCLGGCLLTRHLIDFTAAMRAAPANVRGEARACFEEIADGLAGIPQDHVFWDSVRGTRLCLVVRGWAFFYTVDGETLRIVEVCRK